MYMGFKAQNVLILTVQKFGTTVETLFVLLALFRRRLLIGQRGGEYASAVLHQETDHGQVITTGSTV